MSYAEGVRAYIDGRVQTRAAFCLILTIRLCLFLTGNLVDVDMPRDQLNTWLAVLVTPPGVFAVFSVIFPELDCASSGTTIAAAFTMFSACALSACLIWAKQLSRPHRCWPFVVSIGAVQCLTLVAAPTLLLAWPQRTWFVARLAIGLAGVEQLVRIAVLQLAVSTGSCAGDPHEPLTAFPPGDPLPLAAALGFAGLAAALIFTPSTRDAISRRSGRLGARWAHTIDLSTGINLRALPSLHDESKPKHALAPTVTCSGSSSIGTSVSGVGCSASAVVAESGAR